MVWAKYCSFEASEPLGNPTKSQPCLLLLLLLLPAILILLGPLAFGSCDGSPNHVVLEDWTLR